MKSSDSLTVHDFCLTIIKLDDLASVYARRQFIPINQSEKDSLDLGVSFISAIFDNTHNHTQYFVIFFLRHVKNNLRLYCQDKAISIKDRLFQINDNFWILKSNQG